MADQTLIEIHVQGLPQIAARAADDLMNAVQIQGYVVRINEAVQGIQNGDGRFALDFGDKERAMAEAEVRTLIGEINGGDCLKIEGSSQLDSN